MHIPTIAEIGNLVLSIVVLWNVIDIKNLNRRIRLYQLENPPK